MNDPSPSINTTEPWKPNLLITGLLAFFLSIAAFLYVNKLKWFVVYLIVFILIAASDFYLYGTSFRYAFVPACLIHALFLAYRYNTEQKRHTYSLWWCILLIIGSIFLIFSLFKSFFYETYTFPSSSMEPTIKPNGYLIVKKWGYGTYGAYGIKLYNTKPSKNVALKRGGLYAFEFPGEDNVIYVKRLAALPGDHIRIDKNQVILNNAPLKQEVVSEDDQHVIIKEYNDESEYQIKIIKGLMSRWRYNDTVVPENHYFFLGDNRQNSADSRVWGFVVERRLVGEVIRIVNPSDNN